MTTFAQLQMTVYFLFLVDELHLRAGTVGFLFPCPGRGPGRRRVSGPGRGRIMLIGAAVVLRGDLFALRTLAT